MPRLVPQMQPTLPSLEPMLALAAGIAYLDERLKYSMPRSVAQVKPTLPGLEPMLPFCHRYGLPC